MIYPWEKKTGDSFFSNFWKNKKFGFPYHISFLIITSIPPPSSTRRRSCIRHFSSVESYLLSIEINALYKWVNIIDDMTSEKEQDGNVVTWREERKREEVTYLPDNLVAKDKRF